MSKAGKPEAAQGSQQTNVEVGEGFVILPQKIKWHQIDIKQDKHKIDRPSASSSVSPVAQAQSIIQQTVELPEQLEAIMEGGVSAAPATPPRRAQHRRASSAISRSAILPQQNAATPSGEIPTHQHTHSDVSSNRALGLFRVIEDYASPKNTPTHVGRLVQQWEAQAQAPAAASASSSQPARRISPEAIKEAQKDGGAQR